MDLGVGAVADLTNTVINKIWPDKSEQEKQQLAAAVQVVQGQLDINKEEAKSESVFVSGWRPFIGWICGLALMYQYLARPVVSIWLPSIPIGLDDNLWQLLLGMLGMGGLRTFEKLNGVHNK